MLFGDLCAFGVLLRRMTKVKGTMEVTAVMALIGLGAGHTAQRVLPIDYATLI